jgi:hypothetical protein
MVLTNYEAARTDSTIGNNGKASKSYANIKYLWDDDAC